MNRKFLCLLLILLFSACKQHSGDRWLVRELPSPAGTDSGESNLHSYGSRVYMSWFGARPDGTRELLFSQWNGQSWAAPAKIAGPALFVVNWADFPSIIALQSGMLVAHWSLKAPGGPYASNIRIGISNNDGRTWSVPVSPHPHQTNFEHGFVALSELNMGRFAAIWLDGRNFPPEEKEAAKTNSMMLYYAQYESGRFLKEQRLDDRVCDCCQTDAAPIPNGMIVVYRDRSESEVRDIAYIRNLHGVWAKPKPLWKDGWQIEACPVNGPAVSTSGSHVVVAWFTGVGNQPRVNMIFSHDGGESFGKAVRVDGGNPSGRVDVQWLGDQAAVVTWLENRKEQGAEIRARVVHPDGTGEESFVVAKASAARATGFPRIARFGKGFLVSWTSSDEDHSRVKVVAVER